jgi:hypothetical protein
MERKNQGKASQNRLVIEIRICNYQGDPSDQMDLLVFFHILGHFNSYKFTFICNACSKKIYIPDTSLISRINRCMLILD